MSRFRNSVQGYLNNPASINKNGGSTLSAEVLFNTRVDGRNIFDWLKFLSESTPQAVWQTPVTRSVGGAVVKIPALQELADAKTILLKLEGKPAATVDLAAIKSAVVEALQAGIEQDAEVIATLVVKKLGERISTPEV